MDVDEIPSEAPKVLVDQADFMGLADYRARLDGAMPVLAAQLMRMGIEEEYSDDEWVELAANKLKVLGDMVLAAGINESMLKAIMRG